MTENAAGDGTRPGAGLRTNAAFRRLWTARSISAFGDSLGLVALIVYVADTAGEALAVAALLLTRHQPHCDQGINGIDNSMVARV